MATLGLLRTAEFFSSAVSMLRPRFPRGKSRGRMAARLACLAGGLAAMLTPAARGTLLMEEGFNYTAGGNLANNSPWSGSSGAFLQVVSGGLTWTGVPEVVPPGNMLQGIADGNTLAYRNFATGSVTGGNVYFSMLLNCSTPPTNSQHLASLLANGAVSSNGNDDPLALYLRNLSSGVGLMVSHHGENASSSKVLALNSVHLVVVKYAFGGSGQCSLYIDPTPGHGEPATPDAITATGEGDPVSNLRVVGLMPPNSAAPVNWNLDTLRIGTEWVDVVQWPIPVSASGPQNQLVCPGSPATFSVTATGTRPFSYQWRANGVVIADATDSSYTLTNPGPGDTFTGFDAIVTNAYGSVTSRVATLSFRTPAGITTPPVSPAVQPGVSNVTFRVVASGTTPLTYQWRGDGVAIAGATRSTLTLTNPSPSAPLVAYDVVVGNLCGYVTSTPPAQLIFPHAFLPSDALPGFFGGMNLFTTNAAGMTLYAWSSADPGQSVTNWTLEGALSEQPLNDGTSDSRYTINVNPTISPVYYIIGETVSGPYLSPSSAAWITTDAQGNYDFLTATVTVLPDGTLVFPTGPTLAGPLNQVICSGNSATFAVSVQGTPPVTYQWRANGAPIASGTDSTFTVANPGPADALGTYSVIVGDYFGTATSRVATLTLQVAPTLTSPPASQVVQPGVSAVTFAVAANGTQPLAYQWRADGLAMAGATASSLTLTNPASTAAPVAYDVVVANACGAVTSTPPALLSFAHAFYAIDGLPGFFSGMNLFTTNGPGMSLYTWSSADPNQSITNWMQEGLLSEQPLNDGTGDSRYTINVNPVASPVYYIIGQSVSPPYISPVPVAWITTDEFGNYTFSTALVEIRADGTLIWPQPPSFLSQPLSQVVLAGKTVTLTATVAGSDPLGYQWYFNSSTRLTGSTQPGLTFSNVTAANAGSYTLVATNLYGSASSQVATLTIVPPPSLNALVATGGFRVAWDALAGEVYWIQATTDIGPPASWATLATNTAAANGRVEYVDADYARYQRRFYRLASPPAAPGGPTIVQQPAGRTVIAGQSVSLAAAVAGASPMAYQWFFNSTTPVIGGTNAMVTLASASSAQTGNYSLTVSNAYGSITSSIAVLTVIPPPQLSVTITSSNLQLSAMAVPGDTYWLQIATNLVPPQTWISIATNTADPSGLVRFSVPIPPGLPGRFFRLATP
jgi:hypothetical protein